MIRPAAIKKRRKAKADVEENTICLPLGQMIIRAGVLRSTSVGNNGQDRPGRIFEYVCFDHYGLRVTTASRDEVNERKTSYGKG